MDCHYRYYRLIWVIDLPFLCHHRDSVLFATCGATIGKGVLNCHPTEGFASINIKLTSQTPLSRSPCRSPSIRPTCCRPPKPTGPIWAPWPPHPAPSRSPGSCSRNRSRCPTSSWSTSARCAAMTPARSAPATTRCTRPSSTARSSTTTGPRWSWAAASCASTVATNGRTPPAVPSSRTTLPAGCERSWLRVDDTRGMEKQ